MVLSAFLGGRCVVRGVLWPSRFLAPSLSLCKLLLSLDPPRGEESLGMEKNYRTCRDLRAYPTDGGFSMADSPPLGLFYTKHMLNSLFTLFSTMHFNFGWFIGLFGWTVCCPRCSLAEPLFITTEYMVPTMMADPLDENVALRFFILSELCPPVLRGWHCFSFPPSTYVTNLCARCMR